MDFYIRKFIPTSDRMHMNYIIDTGVLPGDLKTADSLPAGALKDPLSPYEGPYNKVVDMGTVGEYAEDHRADARDVAAQADRLQLSPQERQQVADAFRNMWGDAARSPENERALEAMIAGTAQDKDTGLKKEIETMFAETAESIGKPAAVLHAPAPRAAKNKTARPAGRKGIS